MTMNKYECGVIRVKSAGQLQTKQISTAGGRASLQSFHPRFICVIRGHHFPNARSRIHPSVRFLFSRSALWHQQRVRFHHLAIHSDAVRIFGGGGVGVWLASHFSKEIAGGALAIAMLASAAAIYFACDVRIVSTETLGERMRILWRDILSMVRSAIPLFTIVLVCSPIGAGAMNNLWSAVAPDWKRHQIRLR